MLTPHDKCGAESEGLFPCTCGSYKELMWNSLHIFSCDTFEGCLFQFSLRTKQLFSFTEELHFTLKLVGDRTLILPGGGTTVKHKTVQGTDYVICAIYFMSVSEPLTCQVCFFLITSDSTRQHLLFPRISEISVRKANSHIVEEISSFLGISCFVIKII